MSFLQGKQFIGERCQNLIKGSTLSEEFGKKTSFPEHLNRQQRSSKEVQDYLKLHILHIKQQLSLDLELDGRLHLVHLFSVVVAGLFVCLFGQSYLVVFKGLFQYSKFFFIYLFFQYSKFCALESLLTVLGWGQGTTIWSEKFK